MAFIKITDPLGDYLALKPDIDNAISRVLKSGSYILGEEVASFEQEFATYCQADFGIGVGSGTSALALALRALDVAPGDEVILPSHTATATATAVIEIGATPVYADIASNSYNICPQSIQQCISSKTKAIIAVHLYGHPAPINEIKTLFPEIPIIEDAAQAHGAKSGGKRIGSLGDLACFSFYPTKNLGAFGDGGIITTQNENLSHKLRLLREYGWQKRYQSSGFGTNSRLDEIQAAILRIKLKHLDQWNAKRLSHAQFLINELKHKSNFTLPIIAAGTSPVFHQFVIQTNHRDKLLQNLESRQIQCGIHYPIPNHLQKGYVLPHSIRTSLINTEKACQKIISLPIHQHLPESDLTGIISALLPYDN